jgi:hypothetical protein
VTNVLSTNVTASSFLAAGGFTVATGGPNVGVAGNIYASNGLSVTNVSASNALVVGAGVTQGSNVAVFSNISAGQNYVVINSNAWVGIGAIPTAPLHVQGNMVYCIGTSPRKVYSAKWSVGASQVGSVILTFGNAGFVAKVVLIVNDSTGTTVGINCLSGEYVGGSSGSGATATSIAALGTQNIRNVGSPLIISAGTFSPTAITIAVSAATSSGGSMAIMIDMIGNGNNATAPTLTNIQYPAATTVYTPGY